MTREEAIVLFEKQLTAAQVVLDSGFGSNPGENDSLYRRRKEMAEIALTALRPISREQVERMRYPWERIVDAYGNTEGFLCECGHMDNSASNFCRYCGQPKTDEAVDMVMERLEALKDAEA